MNISIETYGCSANVNNSEIIEGILSKAGHRIVEEKGADFVVINTCTVKGPTENRIIKRMQDIKKPIIVTGCMADAQPELIRKIRENAILVSLTNLKSINKAIEEQKDFLERNKEIKLELPKKSKNSAIEIIQIAEGCVGNCSFCITKIAKGDLFSYPEKQIVEAVRKSSAYEIWLTSQDCGAYGIDRDSSLPKLLKQILALKKDFRLRIGMMNPNHVLHFLDELIELYKDKRVFKFLHLPVQSGNDEILKNMNRRYSVEDFKGIVAKLRKEIPDIHISTDIIAGFPGETDKQFNDSYDLIKEISPDTLNISKFWPRPKTSAAKMKQVDAVTRNERSRKIKELHRKISRKQNEKWLGRECEVYVDEIREGGIFGRNESYKQVVLKKGGLGEKVKVRIREAGMNYIK